MYMKHYRLLFVMLTLIGVNLTAKAQTDVTAQYLTNADFSHAAVIDNHLCGYSHDMEKNGTTYYGMQEVSGWEIERTATATGNDGGENCGVAGAVFSYGSEWEMKGNSKAAPASGPDGSNSGAGLGFFAVWGNGGYYYQEVDLPAGTYTITIPTYNASGTQSNTSYIGFVTDGDNPNWYVAETNPTVNEWKTLEVTFTLSQQTSGRICLGYKSTGSGSGANPHLFFDSVTITYESGNKILDENTAKVEGASASDPILTDFVVNGMFTDNVNGWTCTGGFQNQARANNQDGDFTKPFFENWNGSAQVNKMYQTINNIPNGTYKLKIAAFVNNLADPNESQYVFANNDKTYLTTGSPTFYEVWTVVENNTIEIGLEQTEAIANWMGIDNVSLTYYGAGDVIDAAQAASYKIEWEQAVAAAEDAVDNDDYENVTGAELSALNAEIAKAEPGTAAGYQEATAALVAATKAFISAKSAYDAFVAEKEKAAQFGISATNPSTAEEATAAVEQMMVEEYEVVISEYTTAIELGEWTESGAANFNNEHWSGTTRNYKNQDDSGGKGWNATSWDMSLSQDITLPAGEYVLKVAGRMSAHAFMSLTVKDGDTVLGSVDDFPSKGNTGRGINKEGATSFDADDAAGFSNNNNGSGWEWRYVPFTLTSETTVSIAIEAGARQLHEWASFGDYTVQAKPNIEASLAAYNKAVEAANAAMDANPTVTIGDEYEALEAALAADKGSTIESISEATEAIVAATTAFSSSASAYAAYIAEKAVAEMIGSGTGAEPTTAEEAIAAVQALKEGEYEYVTDNYTYDKTELIGDFPDWDSSATVNGEETDYGTNENEHWSGSPKTYYEQAGAGWGASAWTILFEKTVTLPAGDYMVKVAARASASTVGKMYSSETSTEVALPHNGASTKGIDINGDANFGEGDFVNNGNGFGWEWRYLPISLSEKKSVTITLEVEGKTNYQWASLCDITLLSKQDVPTGITNVGSENANAAKDIYNLQGQKVGKAQKGVFIMNGKKVVVK